MSKSTDFLPVPTDPDQNLGSNPYAVASAALYQSSTGDESLRDYAKAPATVAGYLDDWRQFSKWANAQGVPIPEADYSTVILPFMVPVDLVNAYIEGRQHDLKSATVTRHLSAIKHWHFVNGLPSPTDYPEVRETVAGLARHRSYKVRRATPLYLDEVAQIVGGFDGSVKAVRDTAVLLFGFWSAMRRSELVALQTGDITDDPRGLIVHVARSKTDQTGQGRDIPVAYTKDPTIDAVRAVRAWTELIEPGYLLQGLDRWGNPRGRGLNGETISVIVKQGAASIGLDPSGYSAHSLRAGFVSWHDRQGVPSAAIRVVTGHKSEAMMDVYSRPGDLFAHSASAYVDV